MPKGSLLKQYLPAGVIKVFRRRDCFDRGICQKPLLASSFVKILAPLSCESVLYYRQRVDIPEYTLVERFEINAYSDGPRLLWHDYYPCTPWNRFVYLGDDAHCLHSVQFLDHFRTEWQCHVSGGVECIWFCIWLEFDVILLSFLAPQRPVEISL